MKIAILTADYPPIEGGISTLSVQVARELARAGHEVVVVAPYFPGQGSFDADEPVRVARYRGYGMGWFRSVPMACTAWRHLKQADLVLGINVASGGLIGLLAGLLTGKPYVTFAYGFEFLKFRGRFFSASLLRAVYARARLVVAISAFTRNQLVDFGVSEDRVVTIYPGAPAIRPNSATRVAQARHKYVLDDGPIILAVGRFMPRKGHLTLVQAMPEVLERFPNAYLVLVGRGPAMYDVLQEAARLGVRDRVVFPGRISDEDVAALYEACSVFALPTGEEPGGQVEGFGLVFAEAHAYGKPVVAGRSGGVCEAVLDGETGLLVEPGNPGAVADAIARILEDPALAQRLGTAGRNRVASELNWAEFTRRLLAALEDRP